MSINFDIVIDSPEHSIDMKAGLDTLQGVSEVTRCIAETLVAEHVPQKQSYKSNVRTVLKQSFKGSYGHIYSLEFYDEKLKTKFRTIGNATFAELMSYFMNESLYLESNELSDKAQKIIDDLGNKSEDLIKQLRISSLVKIHEISIKFNHDVKVRYRKNRNEQTILVKLDKSTVLALEAEESPDSLDVRACITRLNIYTGNGRLSLKDANETVAFGFGSEYKNVLLPAKKKFSENLNHNNGLNSDDCEYLNFRAKPIKLRDGKIVKYIVEAIYDD